MQMEMFKHLQFQNMQTSLDKTNLLKPVVQNKLKLNMIWWM